MAISVEVTPPTPPVTAELNQVKLSADFSDHRDSLVVTTDKKSLMNNHIELQTEDATGEKGLVSQVHGRYRILPLPDQSVAPDVYL